MDNPRVKFLDEATDKQASLAGRVFATTVCVCATLVVLMVTIKVGLLLFT